jgi:small multidrug resistance family-3 protein
VAPGWCGRASETTGAGCGRVLAAYGGVFIVGSLLWGMVADGFRPDRWDAAGAGICLLGVGLIMYAPR